VRKKLIKNSESVWEKFQKTVGGDFFDSHRMSENLRQSQS